MIFDVNTLFIKQDDFHKWGITKNAFALVANIEYITDVHNARSESWAKTTHSERLNISFKMWYTCQVGKVEVGLGLHVYPTYIHC